MTAYIKSPHHIHIVFDGGQSVTVYKSQPNYTAVVEAVRASNWPQALDLALPSTKLAKQLDDASNQITQSVRVEHGLVLLNDEPMHGTLVDRMLAMVDEGYDVIPMANFLENLQLNESYRAVTELYGFLEESNLPITPDGHFLAYKRVSGDFKDIHSGTFDNSPGVVVMMDRNQVNEDKTQTCSAGLHFCSHAYLPSYANSVDNKTILIKINPRDVVAIPDDYNNAKGRCCQYEVVSEIDNDGVSAMPVEEARIEHKVVMAVVPGAIQQIQLDTRFPNLSLVLTTHDSADAASEATGINKAAIKRVCNGHRKSTGGFGWKWVTHSGDTQNVIDEDDDYAQEQEESNITTEDDLPLWRIRG